MNTPNWEMKPAVL